MARLSRKQTADVLAGRTGIAQAFARERNVVLVLKGYRTLIAFPDGRLWVNPTGTPAMGTGGAGDILTGLIAGLMAQFPSEPATAIAAAVYLHGLAGELGAAELGELPLVATDLLRYLPRAIKNCASLPDRI
jgi:NAD(P)H-hydrate epimerase